MGTIAHAVILIVLGFGAAFCLAGGIGSFLGARDEWEGRHGIEEGEWE